MPFIIGFVQKYGSAPMAHELNRWAIMESYELELSNSPSKKMTRTGHIATYIEMWFLSFLFVAVVATLLRVQNVQVQSQSQARQERESQDTAHPSRISRNNTPALGY